ncbi:MAG: ABC transporter permease, partial [Limisphaerales bacterium]
RRFAGTKQSIFALVERDYISPLFSSAIAIRALNGAAKQFASFAGYDDFRTRLEVNSAISLVSVTRFSGDLFDILNVDFALRDHRYKDEPCVYLSEALWTTGFARRADIVGAMIKVHDTNYRIAGVTRAFNGLLATTEIWMPISSRGQLGAMNSMKIVGALREDSTWKISQRQLKNLLKIYLADSPYTAPQRAVLLPLTPSITVGESAAAIVQTIRANGSEWAGS